MSNYGVLKLYDNRLYDYINKISQTVAMQK